MNAKKQVVPLVWCAGHLKNANSAIRTNTNIDELSTSLATESSHTFTVAYSIPIRIQSTYIRLTVTGWKKFHRNVLELKKRYQERLQIVPLESFYLPHRSSQDTSLLVSAFDLLLHEPLLFDIWSQLECAAQLSNRQPIQVSTLIKVIAPEGEMPDRNTLKLELLQNQFNQVSEDLAVMLANSHRLQDKLDHTETQLGIQEINRKQVELEKESLLADLLTMNQRLHLLLNEVEGQKPDNQKFDAEINELGTLNQNLKIDMQRLQEQLLFTQEELARQHAIANAYILESVQSEKVFSQVQNYIQEQLGISERS